jgi:hypothetical protein
MFKTKRRCRSPKRKSPARRSPRRKVCGVWDGIGSVDLVEKYFYLSDDASYPVFCSSGDKVVLVTWSRSNPQAFELGNPLRWKPYATAEDAITQAKKLAQADKRTSSYINAHSVHALEDKRTKNERLFAVAMALANPSRVGWGGGPEMRKHPKLRALLEDK